MATDSNLPFLVKYQHPVYYQRTSTIYAIDLTTAQAYAAATVAGTAWTVFSVEPYSA
jgi:hypothetical protein